MKKLFFLIFTAIAFSGFASSFTPGNIVVIRLGDGTAALTSAATPVFLDEYSPTGTLVQSIALPTSVSGSNRILTMSGTATSEGSLTLSANGQYLVLTGYDAATGLVSVSSDSTINRIIGRVDATGAVNTTTGIAPLTAYKKNNIRGAASLDGSAFWCSGSGSTSTGGTYYVPFGSISSSAVQISSTISSTRVVNVFDNQLYTSSASSSYHGVNAVGNGLPTTTGQTSANLPGMPAADTSYSTYGFYLLDLNPNVAGVDVAYVCDDHTSANGGLYKYSLVGGSWVSNGNISSASGLRGITAVKTCSAVKLFVTAETGVYSLVDASGYNQPLTGSFSQIVTAATNEKIRGVAFAPGTTAPNAIALTLNVTNPSVSGASDGSVNLSVTGGTPPYSAYSWNNNSTTQNISGLAAGNYCVTVTDAVSCSASQCATVGQPSGIQESDVIKMFNTYFSNETISVRAELQQPSICSVQLFDVSGRLLQEQRVNTDYVNLEFSTNTMSSSCAFVRITTDRGSVTKRVMIVR